MLRILIKRNIKLFFKDKGMFFTSLITPIVLLVLYTTFLGNVYRDSFLSAAPKGMEFSETLVNGFVGGQLVSSILSVSCVSVAFCANMIMVQDKVNGSIHDLMISPVKPSVLAFGYYLANFITTLMVSFCAVIAGLVFMAVTGWYMSVADIFGLFFGCCAAYNVWNSDIQCCQFLLEITGANFCSQCNY